MKDLIQALPKAELHLHLEGAIPWDIVRENCPDILPETPDYWADDYRFEDFATDFSTALYHNSLYGLRNLDDYHVASKRIFQSLAEQNIRYVELSFSPLIAIRKGLSCREVTDAIKFASPEGLTVRVYGAFNRAQSPEVMRLVHDTLCHTPNLDGVDLHGDERITTALSFAEVFRSVQDAGFCTRAHAGELMGAESVRDALDILHVKRIEHGTNARYDEQLITRLVAENITLDMCPTSNYKLSVVESIEVHPIRDFYERGVKVTVNTDDPTAFGCTLTSELHLLVDKLGFSVAELADLQRNAFNVANMPDDERDAILDDIEIWRKQVLQA